MNRIMALCALLIACIAGWLVWWPAAGVPILAYHQVSAADEIYSVTAAQFEEQMNYLHENGYTSIHLQQLNDSFEGKFILPDKPIVITFDDGYEDNLLAALPIMEKYDMQSTIFIATSLVGTPDYLSWQQIADIQARNTEIGSHTMTHVGLASVSAEQQRFEIRGSKAALEQHLGMLCRRRRQCRIFTPYGKPSPARGMPKRVCSPLRACCAKINTMSLPA